MSSINCNPLSIQYFGSCTQIRSAYEIVSREAFSGHFILDIDHQRVLFSALYIEYCLSYMNKEIWNGLGEDLTGRCKIRKYEQAKHYTVNLRASSSDVIYLKLMEFTRH